MSFVSTFTYSKMNTNLEMLTAREQLMEDIDCIIESNFGEVEYKDDVIRQLCDAVCKNFPAN
jgi:flagellar biosynthesis/type III secretory pathway protein FliH